MKILLSKENGIEMEKQLGHLDGQKGVDVAKAMFKKNSNMIDFCFSQLELENNDKLLELGFGNGSHLKALNKHDANNIKYFGAEISGTMIKEAAKNILDLESEHRFNLTEYDGRILPYSDNFFNKVVMINAIYFVEEPFIFLSEIYRALIYGGICHIAFVEKDAIEKLPFVENRFRLYSEDSFQILIEQTGFQWIKKIKKEEEVITQNGEFINRTYSIFVLRKRR
jgi:ubiquinone/menaquinone biosynthesis C-methylase UbiE